MTRVILAANDNLTLKYVLDQCRKKSETTYNESEIESLICRSIQNRLKIQIQSRYMSDPPASDIEFKNIMVLI